MTAEWAAMTERRWTMLAVALVTMIAGSAAQYGLVYLIPALRAEGLDLTTATLLVSAPIAGILCGLIAWGAAADRWGERVVLVLGSAGAAGSLVLASLTSDPGLRWLALFASGLTGAAVHSASGRLILASFEMHRRGLAMGIRQTGQPLGVALAALVLPFLAAGPLGTPAALIFLAVAYLAAMLLVVVLVRDPVRAPHDPATAAGTPYTDRYLARIHAASAMLVVPQFAVAVFAFDYLINVRGWSIGEAAILLAVSQALGAGTRLAAGLWSDRVGRRLRPMRQLALAIGLVVLALALLTAASLDAAVAVLAVAAVITVSTNGLSYTAVAERAGRAWAGRALGIQNTMQNLVGAAVPTALALLIASLGGGGSGYGAAFAVAGTFALCAAFVIPVGSERHRG